MNRKKQIENKAKTLATKINGSYMGLDNLIEMADWVDKTHEDYFFNSMNNQIKNLEAKLAIAVENLTALSSSVDVILKIDDDVRNRSEVVVKGTKGKKDITLPPTSILTLAKFAQDALKKIREMK